MLLVFSGSARDVSNHPIMYRAMPLPTSKNYPGHNVSNAPVEEPWYLFEVTEFCSQYHLENNNKNKISL